LVSSFPLSPEHFISPLLTDRTVLIALCSFLSPFLQFTQKIFSVSLPCTTNFAFYGSLQISFHVPSSPPFAAESAGSFAVRSRKGKPSSRWCRLPLLFRILARAFFLISANAETGTVEEVSIYTGSFLRPAAFLQFFSSEKR